MENIADQKPEVVQQRLVRRLIEWREELKVERENLGDVGHPDAANRTVGEAMALGSVESELDDIISEFSEANASCAGTAGSGKDS